MRTAQDEILKQNLERKVRCIVNAAHREELSVILIMNIGLGGEELSLNEMLENLKEWAIFAEEYGIYGVQVGVEVYGDPPPRVEDSDEPANVKVEESQNLTTSSLKVIREEYSGNIIA